MTRLAREESGRVLALLARRFNDLDLADESVQEALIEAAQVWPERGIPDNTAGWLLVSGAAQGDRPTPPYLKRAPTNDGCGGRTGCPIRTRRHRKEHHDFRRRLEPGN